MESSSPSGNATEPPQRKWAIFLGSAIALLTLALPPFVISYYSSFPNVPEALPQNIYSIPPRN